MPVPPGVVQLPWAFMDQASQDIFNEATGRPNNSIGQPGRSVTIHPAAMRRAKQPFTFHIGDPGDDDHVALRVDPTLDIARFGKLFSSFMEQAADVANNGAAAENSDGAQVMANIGKLTETLEGVGDITERGRAAFRECLNAADQTKFDEIAHWFGIGELVEIVQQLVTELVGMDPTQPSESSDGS